MPSLPDGILIFVLALLLFGPKRLPVLARELGKWIGEFRRASNEFKMQMEDELRVTEQADRQKEIAAIEAAAPASVVAPALLPGVPTDDPVHPHLPTSGIAELPSPAPLPIATSGELNIMPPATGLPVAQVAAAPPLRDNIDPLLSAIPSADPTVTPVHAHAESAVHG